MAGGKRRGRDDHFEQRGVKGLAEFAEHWIKLAAIVLAAAVGYLEFRNAQLDGFAKVVDNTSLIKAGLVIFFIGWGWGALDDTRIQKRAYRNDPELGRIRGREWAGIVVFLTLFATLFFIPDRAGWFQLTLLALIAVNMWTWRVIFDRTRGVIASTYAQVTKGTGSRNIAALVRLLLIVEYMNGTWQRRRFITLTVFAAVQVPIAFLVDSGKLAPLGSGFSAYGVPGDVLIGYLPGLLFIFYVIVSEIWMKVYRIRIFADLRTADWLEAHFTLAKQRECPLPEPHLSGTFDFTPPSNGNYGSQGPLRLLTANS